MFNRTWRDDELNHLEACNLPDTPGMDLWRLAQQGLRAPARSAAGPESACAAAAGNPSAEGAVSPCSRAFVSACAAAAGSEPFGGSVDPSAEVAPFFPCRVSRVVAVLNFVGCELNNIKNIPLPCNIIIFFLLVLWV